MPEEIEIEKPSSELYKEKRKLYFKRKIHNEKSKRIKRCSVCI